MRQLLLCICVLLLATAGFAQQTTPAPTLAEPRPRGTGAGSADGKPKGDGWFRVLVGRPGVSVAFPTAPTTFISGRTPDGGDMLTAVLSNRTGIFACFWVKAPANSTMAKSPREVTELGLARFSEVLKSVSGVSIVAHYDSEVMSDGLKGGQGTGESDDKQCRLLVRAVEIDGHFLWFGCVWNPSDTDAAISKFIEGVDRRQ